MKDMVGTEVKAGDRIVHITRHGSNLTWSPREVVAVESNHIMTRWVDRYHRKEQVTKVSKNFVVVLPKV